MEENRLMIRIVSEIKKIMDEKHLSSRDLEAICEKHGFKGVTRSKIIRAFYTGEGRQFFLNSTDDTINAVLTSLGYTGDDILKRLLYGNLELANGDGTFNKELREFLKNDNFIPYLKLAYAQCKADETKKELEKIQEQLKRR